MDPHDSTPKAPDSGARVPARVEVIPPGEGPEFTISGDEPEVLPAEHGRARARTGEGRWTPGRALLSRVPGVPTLVALWSYLHHSAAPFTHKLWIIATAAYVIWPRDILPELRLGLVKGEIDDVAVVFALVSFLGSERLAPYRARAKLWMRGKARSPYLDDEV